MRTDGSRIRIAKHSITLTEVLLTIGAMLGALLGGFITFSVSMLGMTAGGPLGFLIFGPIVFALFSVSISVALVVVPLWALLAGRVFAGLSAGRRGSAVRVLGIMFFSDGHAISRATRQLTGDLGIKPVAYVGWFESAEINAFAMGTHKYNSMVVLSRGAIERLSRDQLLAVLAHELAHVANNDMARMTHARGVQEALSFFLLYRGLKRIARWLFTPLSELEILRLSRAREFAADGIAAQLVGPEHMISVLAKLQQETILPKPTPYTNLMMWNGFVKKSWLNTHPPLEDRIAALEQLDFGDVPAPVRLAARTA